MPLVIGMLNMIMEVEKLDNIKRDMRKNDCIMEEHVNTIGLCETTCLELGMYSKDYRTFSLEETIMKGA